MNQNTHTPRILCDALHLTHPVIAEMPLTKISIFPSIKKYYFTLTHTHAHTHTRTHAHTQFTRVYLTTFILIKMYN